MLLSAQRDRAEVQRWIRTSATAHLLLPETKPLMPPSADRPVASSDELSGTLQLFRSAFASSIAATRDVSGWLVLTQQRLSLCKKRQVCSAH
jgi:hypothetical protein